VRLFSIGEPSTSDHTGQEHTLCAVFQSKEVTRVALSIKFHGKVDISESPPDASGTDNDRVLFRLKNRLLKRETEH